MRAQRSRVSGGARKRGARGACGARAAWGRCQAHRANQLNSSGWPNCSVRRHHLELEDREKECVRRAQRRAPLASGAHTRGSACTVTLEIQGIHCGMSRLFVHIANARARGTPFASTRALSTAASDSPAWPHSRAGAHMLSSHTALVRTGALREARLARVEVLQSDASALRSARSCCSQPPSRSGASMLASRVRSSEGNAACSNRTDSRAIREKRLGA